MKPAILLITLIHTLAPAQPLAALADERDGKKYKTVKIGEQIWMAENLNFEAEGSVCYKNEPENCAEYGRLYNWKTALKACPKGWHLPNNAEWDKLYEYADNNYDVKRTHSKIAGKHLKAKSGWSEYKGKSCNGEDTHGFAGLPGGYGSPDGGFSGVGYDGYWWCASESNAARAYSRNMYYDYEDAAHWGSTFKAYLYSVRCVRD